MCLQELRQPHRASDRTYGHEGQHGAPEDDAVLLLLYCRAEAESRPLLQAASVAVFPRIQTPFLAINPSSRDSPAQGERVLSALERGVMQVFNSAGV